MKEKKEISYKKKDLLEKNEDNNPIMAEVNRVKDLRVQAMGIRKDLIRTDESDKELMVKDTPATQIIKKEVQGIIKTKKQLRKEHEFLE